MFSSTLQVAGYPSLFLYDQSGNLKQELHDTNLVVDSGKEFMVRKLSDEFNTGTPVLNTIAIGSGTTLETASDTSLENQIATTTINLTTINGNEVEYIGGFIQGIGTGNITEVGLLASDGTLICRTVVSTPFNKSSTDFLNINWKIQIG